MHLMTYIFVSDGYKILQSSIYYQINLIYTLIPAGPIYPPDSHPSNEPVRETTHPTADSNAPSDSRSHPTTSQEQPPAENMSSPTSKYSGMSS